MFYFKLFVCLFYGLVSIAQTLTNRYLFRTLQFKFYSTVPLPHAGVPSPTPHHHPLQPQDQQAQSLLQADSVQNSPLLVPDLHQQHPHLLLRHRDATGCLHGLQEVRGFLRAGCRDADGPAEYLHAGAPLLHLRDRGWRAADRGACHLLRIVPGVPGFPGVYLPVGFDSAAVHDAVPEGWHFPAR